MSSTVELYEDNNFELNIVIGGWGARILAAQYNNCKGDTILLSNLITRPQITELIENLKRIEANLPEDYVDHISRLKKNDNKLETNHDIS